MKKVVVFCLTVCGLIIACHVSSPLVAVSPSMNVIVNDDRAPPLEAEETLTLPSVPEVGAEEGPCPNDMVEIEGFFCRHVKETCLQYVDSEGNSIKEPENSGQVGRCGTFDTTVCLDKNKEYKHFCIDRYPWPNKVGELPQDWMTWVDAKKAVEAVGKRLCFDSEFTMAAEGANMHPLAYGDGFHRDKNQMHCNIDRSTKDFDVFQATSPDSPMAIKLRGLQKPIGSQPLCRSDYGVYEMAGGIDQWVVNESGQPYVSGLKSGHAFGVRNAARPMTVGHFKFFGWWETGGRGCRDISL